MEKIKIFDKKLKSSGTNKMNKPYSVFTYTFEDGRTAESFEDLTEGTEYEIEIEKVDKYGLQFKTKFPRKPGYSPKDYTFEKKKAALENAINAIRLTELKVTSEQIISLADKFYEFLK